MTTAVRGRAPGSDWSSVTRGVWTAPTAEPDLGEQLRAWSLVLPSQAALTHLTAAALYGWWLPDVPPHPVFVALPVDVPRPRRPGLQVCRHPVPPSIRWVDGLRVTDPAETLLAAARDLTLLDLVVLADCALHLGDVTPAELAALAGRRRRGAPALRALLPLVDERSESAWESVMRVLHHAAEIPVEPQQVIVDGSGAFVARVDLAINGTHRVHEYDGGGHRTPEAQDADLARSRLLSLAGVDRHGFTSRHLLKDGAKIIRATDQLLGRTWDVRRFCAWEALLNRSALRPSGWRRLRDRWTAPVRAGQP